MISNQKNEKSSNKGLVILLSIVTVLLLSGIGFYVYSQKGNKQFENVLVETITNLKKDVISLKKDKEELIIQVSEQKTKIDYLDKTNKDLNLKISELEKLKDDCKTVKLDNEDKVLNDLKGTSQIEVSKEISKCSNNESFIVKEDVLTYKFFKMDIGSWNFEDNDKKDFINVFKTIDVSNKNKEFIIFEIIPIVDSKNYQNDKDGLKQLGLSRMRASVAVGLLNSLNKGKVFLSTEVIESENERGFVIKQYSIKAK